MKKVFVFVITFLFIFQPYVSYGFFLAPYHYLNIVVNSQGGDGQFTFNLATVNPVSGSSDTVQITTQNGSGQINSYDIRNKMALGTGNSYSVSEVSQSGWTIKSISCINDSYGLIGAQNQNSFVLPVYLYTSTTCTFNNQKSVANTPILIIPGVLGTDIKKGTDLLWANPKMAFGYSSFMDPLAFKSNLDPIDNSLTLGAVIRRKPFSDYTDGLISQLVSLGYTEGQDLFTFPYDWRYGVSSSTVSQLKDQINYISNLTDSDKVNIVAHSTGGLLVKKYVQQNPSNHKIGKAVFVGVPNLGAPKALKVLISGDNFDVTNLDPAEMKKISQNMPVVYDLAPTQEYYNQTGSFFHVHNQLASPASQDQDLNFTDTLKTLEDGKYINEQAVNQSQALHTTDFDNLDLRQAGVDLYSIVGCKSATFGKITETITKNAQSNFNFPKITSGDQTVPFVSADSLPVDGTKTFFAPKINHGDLLSADGSRQQIVNILTGSTLSTDGKILTRSEVKNKPDLCQIKGESLKIHSPLSIDITDQNGNHSGPLPDGSIENSIPGADYEVWGDEKYVFVPTDENQQYSINVAGTGSGTFTLDDETINANGTVQTQVFSNLPVTPALTGQVNLGSGGGQATLLIQTTPTATPETIAPSSVVNADESQDVVAPVSTSTIWGTMGQPGFYRSNVVINLSATDLVIPGQENQTSGMLATRYSLDGADYLIYNAPINVSKEGDHTISFFSTDKAGNNEIPQTINFTIDKTAPEALVEFNPLIKDIEFTGIDAISSTTKVIIKDSDDDILLTDKAGNTTKIKLKDKDRKHQYKAEIKSLIYNGKPVDLSKNLLHFDWQFDKKGNLQELEQQIKSKKDFSIEANYEDGKTKLEGKDQNGKINKVMPGLTLLKIITNQGDLNWSY